MNQLITSTKNPPYSHASICIPNSIPVGSRRQRVSTSKNINPAGSKTIPQYLVGTVRGNKGKARNWRKSDNVAYVTWRVTRGPGVVGAKRNKGGAEPSLFKGRFRD